MTHLECAASRRCVARQRCAAWPRCAALLGLLAIMAGCRSLPPQQIYTLSAALDSGTYSGTAAGPVLQLQRVLIPDYLDTTDISWRVGLHELQSSSTGRWGERLSAGITRALGADLASRLPMDVVMLTRPAQKPARQILVTVEALDTWPDGRCVLIATWTILGAPNAVVLANGRDSVNTPAPAASGPGDTAIVAGMAATVAKLADAIAAQLQGLR